MGTNERKRQAKLAQKKKKRKSIKVNINSQALSSLNLHKLAERSPKFPIYESFVSENLFNNHGMGHVILSRKINEFDIAVSVFLLDIYCLGVKDAFFQVLPMEEYRTKILMFDKDIKLKAITAAYARKLVNECIEYASNLGFKPHKDYEIAKHIFGDIPVNDCTESFTFGKNGKPFYMSGPYDSESKVKHILSNLQEHCGEGNYEFMIGMKSL